MGKSFFSPIELVEWILLVFYWGRKLSGLDDAAHAQLSMIFLCFSPLSFDFFHKRVFWPQTVTETSCRLWFLRLAIVSAFLFTLTFICECLFSWSFYSLQLCAATAAFCITDYCEILCHFAACLFLSSLASSRRQTHTFLVCAMK